MTQTGARVVDTPSSTKGRIGRPRPAATDRLILDATIALMTEGGASAATVDAIAERSGCAKTTIYRRWPSRDALILDSLRVAVRGTTEQVDGTRALDRELGSTVRGSARNILHVVQSRVFRAAFPTIADELLGGTGLGERFRAEVFAPIRASLRERIAEDVTRGEIRDDVDSDLVLDLVNGAVLYRALVGERLDEAVVDAIANLILTGAAPTHRRPGNRDR
jgi:AcrR family transcriptional regulator